MTRRPSPFRLAVFPGQGIPVRLLPVPPIRARGTDGRLATYRKVVDVDGAEWWCVDSRICLYPKDGVI